MLFLCFLVSLSAFAVHQPISDKSVGQKSQIQYKHFKKTAGSISVAAKVRRALSLGEAKLQLQTSQTVRRSLPRKAKHKQQRAHEKAEGITREQKRKSKDVGHEEIGGNC